jgi:hypothetical protein
MKATNPEFKVKDGYKDLTPQEKVNYIKEQFVPQAQPQDSRDQFIESYLKAKDSGLTPQDFVRQQNIVETVRNMDSKAFLVNDLLRENGKSEQNPNGWTREDIESHVDGMSPIDRDLKAKERKESFFNSVDTQNQATQSKLAEQVKTQSEEANAGSIKTTIDELFTEMAGTKDIGGIPHTPEDQAAFKQMFTDTVSLNPETGYPRTRELFQDNKVLYEALYLYNKIHQSGEGSLKSFLSTFKEEYKQDILDKTRIAPRQEGGQFQTVAVHKSGDFI